MSQARRGGNALEFALVVPVLLALVTGLVDYSWVFLLRNCAILSAREGARMGAVTDPAKSPENAAASAALETWQAYGLGGSPTIEAFRVGDPQLIVVRITLATTDTIGFVATPDQLRITAAEQMEKQ